MRTSDRPDKTPRRSEATVTAGLTAILTLLLLGIAMLIPLETRNARGEQREMTAFNVWREMLENVPDDAPFFLTTSTLTILSIFALVTVAYVIVAIARLPR